MSTFVYTGGAIAAMIGAECVTIVADIRVGEEHGPRLVKLNPTAVLGIPRLVTEKNWTQPAGNNIWDTLVSLPTRQPISLRRYRTIIRDLIYEHRNEPYIVEPIMAGLDGQGHPFIWKFDMNGNFYDVGNFCVTGYQSTTVGVSCGGLYYPNMGPNGLTNCIVTALRRCCSYSAAPYWGAVAFLVKDGSVTRTDYYDDPNEPAPLAPF